MTTNMKPADELLMIRQKVKELQDRESEIKAGMIDGSLSVAGDFAIASIVRRKSKRFDRKAAEAELGSLARFEVENETVALLINELVRPEEAV